MTYELAKKLKDAGFPQKGFLGYPLYHSGDDTSQMEGIAIPTLSELIEACGGKFENLMKGCEMKNGEEYRYPEQVGKWFCNAVGNEANYTIHFRESEGATPEEAVANLWLTLNKK